MKNKALFIILITIVSSLMSFDTPNFKKIAFHEENTNFIPQEGYVPNAETAIKIAEAIWLPIYGNNIYRSKPFVAELSKNKKVWIVSGTLPPETAGGTPYIEIQKSNCKILKVTHEE